MAVQLEILPLFWALCLHLLLTLPWPYIVSNFILFITITIKIKKIKINIILA